MAKAKKPVSGGKSTSKPDQDTAKPEAAAAAKAQKAIDTASKDAGSKAADAKPSEAKTAAVSQKDPSTSSVPKAGKPASRPSETTEAKPAEAPKETVATKAAPSQETSVRAKPATETAAKPEPKAADKTPSKPVEKPAVTPKAVVPAPQPAPQKSVFWPMVFGGVVAGVIGFVVSEMNVLNSRADTDAIAASIESQGERIATLEAVEMPEAPEMPDLSGLESSIASISEMVSDMEARLAELEARPVIVADGDDGVAAAYAQEFEALKASAAEQFGALEASVAAQKGEIQRLLDEALSAEQATAEAARAAAAQTALTTITAALATGEDFSEALAALNDSGIGDVPAALAENAGGVPMIQTLQGDFPDTARIALGAVRSSGDDGEGAGVGSFLRRQLGARSVAPREGSDPDAVLSRAEAAVRAGDLDAALSEIETLPEGAQAAMADWLAAAQARAATQAAVQDLSQRLTAN